jgi:Fe-S cluster assembly scaffold protein SufB
MVTKSVKSVHYLQINNKVKEFFSPKGTIVLPSYQAWEKFDWTRGLFGKKPKEGYFIWVKEQPKVPLATCVSIASPRASQSLLNLLVIEKNIKAKANVVCNALKSNLCGSHRAEGKLILKEGASLNYTHNHQWGSEDFVSPNYQFILEKNSKLKYDYRNLFPPKTLNLKTAVFCKESSSSNLNFVINGVNSKVNLEDKVLLEGRDSQGILRLRLVGKENSQISARSTVLAKAPGKGHLDCQGLLVDEKSKISLVPELICQNRLAQITHEASIGRISEEELIYLRMRGLPESEAVDLIVSGFLGI